MENKPADKINVSALFNILAGVLFMLAAFHPLTGEKGIDYAYIFIGLLLLIVGIMEVRKKSK